MQQLQLMLDLPGRYDDREGFIVPRICENRYHLALLALVEKRKKACQEMNETIAYCKPNVVVLGSVMEIICGTLIKGHTGLIEAIHWRIVPAYDLDE